MGFSISLTRNDIPQVRASIVNKSVEAVRSSAHYTQNYASVTAPRKTGAFAASIYVNGPENDSDYAQHASAAASLNPNANIMPEVKAAVADPKVGQLRDQATGQFTFPQAIVSSAVEYSLYLEEGTVYMAPRPVLHAATLAAENLFKSLMSQVAKGF